MVSVLIPNFNHAAFLQQRIDSVLSQTYDNIEFILLDDASTDESRSIMEQYRTHPRLGHIVYNEQNTGSPFKQWAKGLELAKGKYIWIAESDDFASPFFLESLVSRLQEDEKNVLAFCGSEMIDAIGDPLTMNWDKYGRQEGELREYTGKDFIRRRMKWKNSVYNASAVVFRRDALTAPTVPIALSPIDNIQAFRYCGDWLFWVNICIQGNVVEVCKQMNYFRQHDNKVSPNAERQGLYFTEGVQVMRHIADILQLNGYAQSIVAARTYKRLRAAKNLSPETRATMKDNIGQMSPLPKWLLPISPVFYACDKLIKRLFRYE